MQFVWTYRIVLTGKVQLIMMMSRHRSVSREVSENVRFCVSDPWIHLKERSEVDVQVCDEHARCGLNGFVVRRHLSKWFEVGNKQDEAKFKR